MSKTILITGVTGQDGSYLAKLMLERGYTVVGGVRRTSSDNTWRLAELGVLGDVELIDLNVAEITNIFRMIQRVQPDEIYNLAAQSFVRTSFDHPIYTADIDALGPARFLEVIRTINPAIRFYQASTSEMYGKVAETPQSEHTPFHPRSPYAVSKLYAHWITINYRESYGLHACCGILFNHESPLRGREFVTRKITSGLAQVKYGKLKSLAFGNLDAKRDWGFAGEYVDGIRRILQAPQPVRLCAGNRSRRERAALHRACSASLRLRAGMARHRCSRDRHRHQIRAHPRRDRSEPLPPGRGGRAGRCSTEGGARTRLARAGDPS